MENGVIKDDDLSLAQQQFLESYDASIDMRAEGEQARDYYDGKQWTAAEIDTLRKRKQPVITDNRIKDKVEYLLGLERRTRTDPRRIRVTPTTRSRQRRLLTPCDTLRRPASLTRSGLTVSKIC